MSRITGLLGLVLLLVLAGCDRQPYPAPEGTVLMLTADRAQLEQGESALLTVQGVLANGSPLWDGTEITLQVSNGRLEATRLESTDGAVQTRVYADGDKGELSVRAFSGLVVADPDPLVLTVGQVPEVERLVLSAQTPLLPFGGGQSVIVASVYDAWGSPLENIPVTFSCDGGRMVSDGAARLTNAAGQATDVLKTEVTAVVTVLAGDLTATVTVTVEAQGQKPVADFVFSPSQPKSNETTYFNGSPSYDPDGRVVRWSWDFGDGSSAEGAQVTHAFINHETAARSFVVLLRVMDNEGNQATTSRTVSVLPRPLTP